MKDDYHYERIFNLSFITLATLSISSLISTNFFPVYQFWFNLFGLTLGYGIGGYWQKIKFYESFNSLVISLLPWFGVIHLVRSIANSSLIEFVIFWVCLLLIFLYFLIESQYRKFIWYKSGRVGFSGLMIAGIFFALQVVVLDNIFEKYISTAIAFVFFLLLYKLSRSKE